MNSLFATFRRPQVLAAGLVSLLVVACAPVTDAPDSAASEAMEDVQTQEPIDIIMDEQAAAVAPAEKTAEGEEEAPATDIAVLDSAALAKVIEEQRGKVLVMNYWATWCPPCVHEMPEFIDLYSAIDKDKVAFISVSVDRPVTLDDAVKPFVAEKKLPFPVIVFDGMPDELAEAVDVGDWTSAVPATFVYDAEGALHKSWNEEVTQEIVTEAIAGAAGGA